MTMPIGLRRVFGLSILSLCGYALSGHQMTIIDPCTTNDDCASATVIQDVISDQSYVCIPGCNLNASPDPLVSGCLIPALKIKRK